MKTLSNGYYAVTLQVSPETVAFARTAARNGFYGVEDYLNAVLNTAMLREMDEAKARQTVGGGPAEQPAASPETASDDWDDLPI